MGKIKYKFVGSYFAKFGSNILYQIHQISWK